MIEPFGLVGWSWAVLSMHNVPIDRDHAVGLLVLGNSEIRVPSSQGNTVFAAPSLV